MDGLHDSGMASSADDIRDNAVNQPKSVLNDGFRAEAHPIGEMIEADKHAEGQKEAKKQNGGIVFRQFRHQGPVV